jgi:hypothetical protein
MSILHTPQTPRWNYIAGLLVILLSWNNLKAQNGNNTEIQNQNEYKSNHVIKSLETYERSLTDYYVRKWRIEHDVLSTTKAKRWWRYMPSIGIQLGLPSIVWNPYNIMQIEQDKRVLEANLKAIDERYLIEYQDAIKNLEVEYNKLIIQNDIILKERRMLENYRNFFNDFTTREYQDKIITPKEFQQKRIEMEEKEKNIWIVKQRLETSILDFLKLAKYELIQKNPFH